MRRKMMRILVTICMGGGFLVFPPAVSPACGSSPGQPYLDGFALATSNNRTQLKSLFYAGAEGTSATATIRILPGDCTVGGQRGRTGYATLDGTATQPLDYQQQSGTSPELCADVHPDPQYCPSSIPVRHQVPIPLAAGDGQEAAVEAFSFNLSGAERRVGGGSSWSATPTGAPSAAPVYVVDVDGPQRFSFEPRLDGSGPVEYSHGEPFNSPNITHSRMLIPVFRAGPAGTATSAEFELVGTGADPATPGVDVAIPATHNPLTFEPTARWKLLAIDIKQDLDDEPDETFEVRLKSPAPAEAGFDAAAVTILDNDEAGGGGGGDLIAPRTWFHHPKQNWTYPRSHYRVRQMHAFFRDNKEGSGVTRVQMALRKRMEDGRCAWWKGGRFRSGPCGKRQWFGMQLEPTFGDMYLKDFPRLKPTRGTRIRDYKAWSRGTDLAGNVETSFKKGKNANRFWIKR